MSVLGSFGDVVYASSGSRVADALTLDANYRRRAATARPPGYVWHHAAVDRVQLINLPLHAGMPHVSAYPGILARHAEAVTLIRRGPAGDVHEAQARKAQRMALERQLALRLPDAFRRYLDEVPGGPAAAFEFAGPDGERVRVDGWLALARNDAYGLIGIAARAVDQLPEGALPFAFDAFGNLLVLDLARSPAPVRYFEHDAQPDAVHLSHCRVVAPDFAAFIGEQQR